MIALSPHAHSHTQNRFAVLPTAARLGADPELLGRGVTLAIIDSGFAWHPDLVEPAGRLLAYVDLEHPDAELELLPAPPPAHAWHGTQTAVVAAGSGRLSEWIYHGLAPEARLVLVAVGGGHIDEERIARGLEWVIAHRERYGIRVVSISLGADEPRPLAASPAAQAAERAVAAGLVVVAAAGNAGCSGEPRPVAPATAPHVITVGGYDDGNRLERDPSTFGATCSSFGTTPDGIVKPELIAPAIWVAAPILCETDAYRRAEALSLLAQAPDYLLPSLAREHGPAAALPAGLAGEEPDGIRALVERRLREAKIVATHYQHVDGTSFAAPIVAALVAQMLEANPALTPAVVKQILIATAARIPNQPALRQGYGVLDARRAVAEARRVEHAAQHFAGSPPRIEEGALVFELHDDTAQRVAVVCDWTGWSPDRFPMARADDGLWRAAITPPPPGPHAYKFLIDGRRWIEDPSHGLKAPDLHGGLNSILHLA